MAHILFYEKPGCINNTRQKEWLKAAGHEVEAVNILDHNWSEDSLKPFFGKKPVADWFNRTAPAVKSGELNPDDYSREAAIQAMIDHPILVKRPLMVIDHTHFVQGFDKEALHAMIGLSARAGHEAAVNALNQADLTTCPRLNTGTSCEEPDVEKPLIPSLGSLIQLVEEMGLEVTYAFEDLVFVSHSAFMFQFIGDKKVALYFNRDCAEDDASTLEKRLLSHASAKELSIRRMGRFSIEQNEGEENLNIQFFDENI